MDLKQFDGLFFNVIRNNTFDTLGNLGSSPKTKSLCFAENITILSKICKSEMINCVICSEELKTNVELVASGKGIAVSEQPRRAFYELHNWLVDNSPSYCSYEIPTYIGPNCHIHKTAVISEKGVVIGDNVTIEEYAVIRPGTYIENDVHISAGAIIGGENHIITRNQDDNLFLVKQVGKTIIKKGVAIGYHSMISKGTFPYDETIIGEHSKIESFVEIAHNSKIGSNCIVTGQCLICGNSIVGDNTRINPQAVVSNQVKVGEHVTIEIGSVVVNDIKDNEKVAGNFAIEHMKFLLWHKKKLSKK